MENAAICDDDLAIEALAAQLAPELATLKEYVTDLAHRYQFEQILNLIHPFFRGIGQAKEEWFLIRASKLG